MAFTELLSQNYDLEMMLIRNICKSDLDKFKQLVFKFGSVANIILWFYKITSTLSHYIYLSCYTWFAKTFEILLFAWRYQKKQRVSRNIPTTLGGFGGHRNKHFQISNHMFEKQTFFNVNGATPNLLVLPTPSMFHLMLR